MFKARSGSRIPSKFKEVVACNVFFISGVLTLNAPCYMLQHIGSFCT